MRGSLTVLFILLLLATFVTDLVVLAVMYGFVGFAIGLFFLPAALIGGPIFAMTAEPPDVLPLVLTVATIVAGIMLEQLRAKAGRNEARRQLLY